MPQAHDIRQFQQLYTSETHATSWLSVLRCCYKALYSSTGKLFSARNQISNSGQCRLSILTTFSSALSLSSLFWRIIYSKTILPHKAKRIPRTSGILLSTNNFWSTSSRTTLTSGRIYANANSLFLLALQVWTSQYMLADRLAWIRRALTWTILYPAPPSDIMDASLITCVILLILVPALSLCAVGVPVTSCPLHKVFPHRPPSVSKPDFESVLYSTIHWWTLSDCRNLSVSTMQWCPPPRSCTVSWSMSIIISEYPTGQHGIGNDPAKTSLSVTRGTLLLL